jgi:uncharacterized membrane protein
LLGTASALALLGLLVLVLGQSLSTIPLEIVQLVVGTLLLLFGLRWLRKAVLRSAGVLALHDEVLAFAAEAASLRNQGGRTKGAFDKVAFATAFKIVMLEGIEVVFIVIALGAGGRLIVPAFVGALLALLVVIGLGFWLHKPLANIPENTLKFGVGVMLAAFGTFWVGEGIGLEWPGADWSVLGLIAAYLVVGLVLVQLCRSMHKPSHSAKGPKSAAAAAGMLGMIWNEMVGLFVDDGLLAVGTVVWVAAVWAAEAAHAAPLNLEAIAFAVGLCAVLSVSAVRRARI